MTVGIIVGVALYITGWAFAFFYDEGWAWFMMLLITIFGVVAGFGFAVARALEAW